jgi:hypothetical protein
MGAVFIRFATTGVHGLIIARTAAVRVIPAPHVTPSPVKTSIEKRSAWSGYSGYNCATRKSNFCQDFNRSEAGSGYTCATRKSIAGQAVAQWRSFWARALLCALFQIAKSGVIRLCAAISSTVRPWVGGEVGFTVGTHPVGDDCGNGMTNRVGGLEVTVTWPYNRHQP